MDQVLVFLSPSQLRVQARRQPWGDRARVGGLAVAFLTACGLIWGVARTACAESREIVLDTVLASVNEQPITLSDLNRRLARGTRMSVSDATSDPEARRTLETLILERLVEAEAARRKLVVDAADVDRYVGEIAKRNNLSLESFKAALSAEQRDFEDYRGQVKADILRSKLSQSVMQSGVAVTETEIDRYLEAHPELTRSGTKLKLRHIFLDGGRRSEADAVASLDAARERLVAGEDFRTVAAAVSESPDAADGGLLGVVAEKDLSPEIFDAVFALEPGVPSAVTKTPQGYHLFWVDERFAPEATAENERLRGEIRRTLVEQKNRGRLENFFMTELYKAHSVDRKI